MTSAKESLIPPAEAVNTAKAVMGAIDLDPWSSREANAHVMAARFYEKTDRLERVIHYDWTPPGKGRLFLAATDGALNSRRLLNHALLEYRAGRVQQALIWIEHNETLIKAPWVWDFPMCIPFRRLKPRYYDEGLERLVEVAPSDWSVLLYMPPAHDVRQAADAISRLHTVCSTIGRVIQDADSGQTIWQQGYEVLMGKPYSNRN